MFNYDFTLFLICKKYWQTQIIKKRGKWSNHDNFSTNILLQMDRGAQKRKQSALKIDLKSTNGLYMTTVNPCNDFLVDFLIASKLKSEKQGIGKFTTYNLAIQSVRKYPLPIICEAQLAALEGFGDFFINQAAKRIQKHYKRGRLPTQQQILQDDQQHFQALQNNRRKGYRRKKQEQNEDDQGQQQNLGEQQQQQNEQQRSQQEEVSEINDTNKNNSSLTESRRLKKLQRYKPRKQSEPWKILAALFFLDARSKAVSKGQINQIFFNWSKDSVKSWEFCRGRLRECGYIENDKVQNDLIKLTQKGYNFVFAQLGPAAQKFKQKMLSRSQDANKTLKIDNNKGKMRLVDCQGTQGLKIVINSNIEISQQLKYLVPKVLGNDYKFEEEQLLLGSFVWKVYEKVLDFLVIRYQFLDEKFNKENLAIACNLARSCQWGHIIVIVEGMIDVYGEQQPIGYDYDELIESKMELMKKTLLDCRVADFKVLCVKDLEATLHYIAGITDVLKEKLKNIKDSEGIYIAGTLQSINKKVKQSKMIAKLYSKCLRLLPGINKSAAEVMTLKFGTFKLTEQKMREKFKTMQLRKKFLQKLLQTHNVSEQNIDKILVFLYSDEYK